MRRHLMGSALLAAMTMMLAGCGYRAPVMPPQGGMFSSFSAPLDIDADQTPVGARMGESSSMSILGLFAFGDASVDAAARNGNLQRIQYLDYHYLNILGLYQEFTTRAYGE